MNKLMLVVAATFGIIGVVVGTQLESSQSEINLASSSATHERSKEPLYWVAPMDPNYRRNEPGLSPMGMDLVPVYDEAPEDQAAGTVTLNAGLQNQLSVTTGQAQVRAWQDQLILPAIVRFNPEQSQVVQVRAEGWVRQQFVFSVGEQVTRGQPLFTWYSPRLISAQEEFLSALRSGQKGLIAAAESRLLALDMSSQWLQTLRRERKLQEEITVLAPQNGVIQELTLRPGAQIMPTQKLLTLVNPNALWIEIHIPPGLEQRIEIKDAVILTDTQGHSVTAEIAVLYPLQEGKLRSQVARVEMTNDQLNWLDGQYVRADIRGAEDESLQIPASALIDDGHQQRVVLADGQGHFRSIAVTTRKRNAQWVEICSGLEVGDLVVTNAQFLIDSESSVASDLQRYEKATAVDEMNSEEMDHFQMNHEGMNHEEMNHEEMDHSQMNHEGMNHD
ncbi:efflux RND transporter periplasmic adaptor subunit [Thalassolituus oleivorans]|uniref:efflux RND transporter periplasmic adaptor subunit n=1 Tax=Thalassolituus oleivorans TaxID=187493 RepID=UPI0030C87FEB